MKRNKKQVLDCSQDIISLITMTLIMKQWLILSMILDYRQWSLHSDYFHVPAQSWWLLPVKTPSTVTRQTVFQIHLQDFFFLLQTSFFFVVVFVFTTLSSITCSFSRSLSIVNRKCSQLCGWTLNWEGYLYPLVILSLLSLTDCWVWVMYRNISPRALCWLSCWSNPCIIYHKIHFRKQRVKIVKTLHVSV